jgi:predicted nucleotidyltransferase
MEISETLLKRRRRALRKRRYDEALKKLRLAIDYLYQEGAKGVYIFGSIRDPEKFTEQSDIDLAVRGIPEEKHLEVEGKLGDIFDNLEYDIIFLEDEKYLRKEIMERINEEAVLNSQTSQSNLSVYLTKIGKDFSRF